MELVARADCGGYLLVEQGHDPVHQRQRLLLPLRLRQGSQSGLTELPQVAGQSLGGFGGVEGLEVVLGYRVGGQSLVDSQG